MMCRNMCVKVIIAVIGISSSLSAVANAQTSSPDPAKTVAALADVSMIVWGSGKLDIAGVLSTQKDNTGATTVVVSPKGDFDLDTVITLNVSVFYDVNGELWVLGIDSVYLDETSGNVTMTVSSSVARTRHCEYRLSPLSGDLNCVPVDDGCPGDGDRCGLLTVDDDDSDDLICDCKPTVKPVGDAGDAGIAK